MCFSYILSFNPDIKGGLAPLSHGALQARALEKRGHTAPVCQAGFQPWSEGPSLLSPLLPAPLYNSPKQTGHHSVKEKTASFSTASNPGTVPLPPLGPIPHPTPLGHHRAPS